MAVVESESTDVDPVATGTLRRGTVGTGHIVFFVVAAAAPLASVAGNAPLAFALGDGSGVPGAYVLASLVLLLFAVGYAAMSRHVVNAGAFYAYITKGLGRAPGLGAAYASVLTYNVLQIALYGLFGFFAHSIFRDQLSVTLPWWAWAAGALVLATSLGYVRVDASARVLGVLLIAESIVLVVLTVAVALDGGPQGWTPHVFAPSQVFSGAPGVAVMWAFASFIGFEATAIYGEEAKDPRRTVARATYVAVALIGAFYALSTWAVVSAYGASHIQAAAAREPEALLFGAAQQYVGRGLSDAMQILLVTSVFAVTLAFHNAASRYMFALGRDGLLPRALASTHGRWGSPHVAALAQSALAAVCVAVFALAHGDPYRNLFSWGAGIGTVGILGLQAVCAFAVAGFFWGRAERRLWSGLAAPAIAGGGLSVAVVLVVHNYRQLSNSESGVVNHLWLLVPCAAVGGFCVAWAARARS